MTSGTFQSYLIDSITVNRAERQRRTIEVTDLLESIQRIGLINPIIIERSGLLRAGERRLTACKQLGWTNIAVQFVEDLDEPSLQLLELDENIKRSPLTWQEECEAIARYHALRKNMNKDWTVTQTADALGMSIPVVSHKLGVSTELKQADSKVHQASKYSEARNYVFRKTARAEAAVLEKITPAPLTDYPILLADFNKWQPTYSGPKFNFIHCDFPYGIGFNSSNRQNSDKLSLGTEYDDEKDVYWKLLATLRAAMDNVVADSAHLMFWFSMNHHYLTQIDLEQMGWAVNPFPLVWLKSDNAGILPDPARGPRRIYETAFLASRGDRKIVQAVANAIASPTTKDVHPSEKPLPVLRHFFRMIVDEHTTIFDPTAGSGNALRAAPSTIPRLGLERDLYYHQTAKERFYDS